MQQREEEIITKILADVLSADTDVRNKAEMELNNFIQNQFSEFIRWLPKIIFNESMPQEIRNIGSIILKNVLNPKVENYKNAYQAAWTKLDQDVKNNFISILEEHIVDSDKSRFNYTTSTLGSAIALEYLSGNNIMFLERMRNEIKNKDRALGILKIISALSIKLYYDGYKIENEGLIIYQIATEHIKTNDKDLVRASFECIESSMDNFVTFFNQKEPIEDFLNLCFKYKDTNDYVIFRSVSNALLGFLDVNHKVLLDYFSSISSFYISVANGTLKEDVVSDVVDYFETLVILRYTIEVDNNLDKILPILYDALEYETYHEKSWTSHKTSCSFLSILNNEFGAAILQNQISKNFIIENMSSHDSERRAIGEVALGCICSRQNSNFLLNAIKILEQDIKTEVAGNHALYAIGRICEEDLSAVVSSLNDIYNHVYSLISNESPFSENAVWLLSNSFDFVNTTGNDKAMAIISSHYQNMLQCLISRMTTLQPEDTILRNAIFTALTNLFKIQHNEELNPLLIDFLYTRITEGVNSLYQENGNLAYEEIVGGYIVLLSEVLYSSHTFDKHRFYDFCQCALNLDPSIIQNEVYLMIARLYSYLDKTFITGILEKVISDFNPDNEQICKSILPLYTEIAIDNQIELNNWFEYIVYSIISYIIKESTSFDMKIKLIELLGVFALSSRSKFIDYISTCVQMSNYVCQLERDSNPIIVDKMRQKTLKMLSCIVIAVGNNSTLCETLPEIIFCLKVCIEDNNAYRNYDQECAGLIIDLYNAFQTNEVKDSIFRRFVSEIEIYNTVEKSLINQLKDVLEF